MTNHADALPAHEPSRRIYGSAQTFRTFDVLGVRIAAINMREAVQLVASWAADWHATRIVTFANVHMVTEAHGRLELCTLLEKSDLNCPDGMPLAWIGKRHFRKMSKVSGPDFLEKFCAATDGTGIRHFFYGGAMGIAARAVDELRRRHRSIAIAGWCAPPFRALNDKEDEEAVARINESEADVVWVGLGCPKQEIWMQEHRSRLRAPVLLGVGQAFDIVAGAKRRAPLMMRAHGLEWLFRMLQEPGRLIGRYPISNSKFLGLLALDGLKKLVHVGEREFMHKSSFR